MPSIQDALEALKRGTFVLVYDADGREEETDFVIPSLFVSPQHIFRMRRDGGGLICATLTAEHADRIGIPYMYDVLKDSSAAHPLLDTLMGGDIPYDSKSAFSLTINHRESYTGITDNDRSLCISALGKLVGDMSTEEDAGRRFASLFRTPGHVHLLRASPGLLDDRQGHTELSTALCLMAGVPPSAAICEMMGKGTALPKEEARKYALANGFPFLEGKDVLEAWAEW